MSDKTLDQLVELALHLSVAERKQLIDRVFASVAQEGDQPAQNSRDPKYRTWGQEMIAFLDQLDTSEWEAMDIPDSVEWVKAQRRKAREHRGLQWTSEE